VTVVSFVAMSMVAVFVSVIFVLVAIAVMVLMLAPLIAFPLGLVGSELFFKLVQAVHIPRCVR
jgi:hypothetical protein